MLLPTAHAVCSDEIASKRNEPVFLIGAPPFSAHPRSDSHEAKTERRTRTWAVEKTIARGIEPPPPDPISLNPLPPKNHPGILPSPPKESRIAGPVGQAARRRYPFPQEPEHLSGTHPLPGLAKKLLDVLRIYNGDT